MISAKKVGHFILANARCAKSAMTSAFQSIEVLQSGRILLSENSKRSASTLAVDLEGYLILPGLINSHDHLHYALHPRLGNPPYKNYIEWGEDIHSTMSEQIALYNAIDRCTRLWWGGIRNLLCGVTTVCHHDEFWSALTDPDFPIKVLSAYGWSHSTALGKDLEIAHACTEDNSPFIVHAGEGVDSRSADEFWELEDRGLLDEKTVLIHGLALDEKVARMLGGRGVSLILCPSSNQFLYERVPEIKHAEAVQKLALGSDSPLTANGDLLDEINFAGAALGLTPERLYELVTTGAASVLRLQGQEGTIRSGGPADIIAVRDTGEPPANRLSTLKWQDVELVILGGRVHLASSDIYIRLPTGLRDRLNPLEIDGVIRWLHAPVQSLVHAARSKQGPDAVRLGGRTLNVPSMLQTVSADSNMVRGNWRA